MEFYLNQLENEGEIRYLMEMINEDLDLLFCVQLEECINLIKKGIGFEWAYSSYSNIAFHKATHSIRGGPFRVP